MNAQAFEKLVQNFKKMSEKKIFSYLQIVIKNNKSYKEIDQLLLGLIRTNDVVGLDNDGKVNVLLSQATTNDLPRITPRFENRGVEFDLI